MDNKNDCFVGVDIGSSGVRACVINKNKEIIFESRFSYDSSWSSNSINYEEEPSIWWDACIYVLDDVFQQSALEVKSICVNGTSGTVLLCDKNGHPIGKTLLHDNSIAAYQLPFLRGVAPSNSVVHTATSALAKFLHLSKNLPNNVKYVLHQADWITGRLANKFGFSDENNALKMGFDPINGIWPKWMRNCPIDLTLLPQVLPIGSSVGNLNPALKRRWDLTNFPAIVIGTTDSTAASLACGIKNEGDAVTVLGSTLVLKIISKKPIFNSKYGVYSQKFGDKWLVGGASNTGGNVLLNFFSIEQIKNLSKQINYNRKTNLNYYPLKNKGERFPRNNPELLPKVDPRPSDDIAFLRGLLEGISFIEKEGYQKLQELGAPRPLKIFTSGSGRKNKAWKNMRSHILKIPMEESTQTEAAYGSALIALGEKFSKNL